MTQDKLNKAVELCDKAEQNPQKYFYTMGFKGFVRELKSLLQSDNYNTVLEEEINHCNTMLHNPPTESCKFYYEGKKTGLEIAKSLL